MSTDILDRLAAYAPTPNTVADEWGPDERAERLASVLDENPGPERRLRFTPRAGALRNRAIAPIAASVTVLAVAGALAVVAGHGSDGSPAGGPGASGVSTSAPAPRVFHATVATPRLTAHQWAYRVTTTHDPSHTSTSTTQRSSVWVAADGSGEQLSVDSEVSCGQLLDEPVTSFAVLDQYQFDKMPDQPDALKTYLTDRVQGSTSREEAIFIAVGDLLRYGDLLASSAQRAAMVTVLAQLKRTSVHDDVDERGRKAVRIDFVDPNQRGGEIQSLYFDPRTFQLLEERASTQGSSAVPKNEPSAPYTSTPSAQASSDQQLPAQASMTVMTAEKVVSTLPPNCGQK